MERGRRRVEGEGELRESCCLTEGRHGGGCGVSVRAHQLSRPHLGTCLLQVLALHLSLLFQQPSLASKHSGHISTSGVALGPPWMDSLAF